MYHTCCICHSLCILPVVSVIAAVSVSPCSIVKTEVPRVGISVIAVGVSLAAIATIVDTIYYVILEFVSSPFSLQTFSECVLFGTH